VLTAASKMPSSNGSSFAPPGANVVGAAPCACVRRAASANMLSLGSIPST
jgi:hypothetical protein